MKLCDCVKTKGSVTLILYGVDGKIKQVSSSNQVQNNGKYGTADNLLASPTIAKPGWCELGTGSGQAASADTLATYISGSRTAFDSKTRSNNVVTMTTTFAAGVGTGTITEAGIFNVVTQNTGNMYLYSSSFTAIPKQSADSLVVTWTFTIG